MAKKKKEPTPASSGPYDSEASADMFDIIGRMDEIGTELSKFPDDIEVLYQRLQNNPTISTKVIQKDLDDIKRSFLKLFHELQDAVSDLDILVESVIPIEEWHDQLLEAAEDAENIPDASSVVTSE